MPKTNLSLLDLRSLSKPAEKLIDAVSGAIGVFYEPRRIRNKARADADAAVILATGDAQAEEIHFRAKERMLHTELRRQSNIEAIVSYALEELPDSASDNPVDDDWIHHFFGNCQDVSNDQMQLLWARVLAGEVSMPGQFSKRFLEFMKCLGMKEAVLISEFYRYVWTIESEGEKSAAYLNDDLIYMNAPSKRTEPFVPYSLRMEMSHLGLIHENILLRLDRKGRVDFSYQQQRFFSETNNFLPYELPVDALSTLGEELLLICEPVAAPEYSDACVHQYHLAAVDASTAS